MNKTPKERYADDQFYSPGLLGIELLDPFKYRGRGRPRSSDYTTLVEAQKKLNTIRSLAISPPEPHTEREGMNKRKEQRRVGIITCSDEEYERYLNWLDKMLVDESIHDKALKEPTSI